MKTRIILFVLLYLIVACSENKMTIADYAIPFDRSELLPSASDITMRSLRFHPQNEDDPWNTFEALEGFHVTRLEWTYLNFDSEGNCLDTDLVNRVKQSGRVMGGSGSGPHGIDQQNKEERYRLGVLGLDGNLVIPQHKKNWDNPTVSGCMNNPELLKKYVAYVKKYIDAGVVTMQRDEPSTNGAYGNTGLGCYCRHCIAGFREYLAENVNADELKKAGVNDLAGFDYRNYLIERGENTSGKDFDWSDKNSIRQFITNSPLQKHFSDYQEEVNLRFNQSLTDSARTYATQKGVKGFTYSCNNTSFQEWSRFYLHPFDFAISELMLQSSNPGHLYKKAQEARDLGKLQVFGSPKSMGKDLPEDSMVHVRRRVIATAYASGGLASVPWDVFEQSSSGGLRYFGKFEEYADLYGFIRANHNVLENYCTAGALGMNIQDERYPDGFPVLKDHANDSLCIFLRATPGDKAAPVVIHLVDWSEHPAPSVIKLKKSVFSDNRNLSVELRIPKPYQAQDHKTAEEMATAMRQPGEKQGGAQAEAYAPLVEYINLETENQGEFCIVRLPAMKPWGILVVKGE